jgi:hypothetical protein
VKDRLPGGTQAAALRGEPRGHHALSARLGGALREGAGFRAVAGPAGDLRARPAPHAQRRGVSAEPATRGRLDFIVNNACQTCAGRRVLRAHDGGQRGGAARSVHRSWWKVPEARPTFRRSPLLEEFGSRRPFPRPAGPGPAAGGPARAQFLAGLAA